MRSAATPSPDPTPPGAGQGGATGPAAGSRALVAGAALTAVVLWASTFPGTRYALTAYSPLPLALLRLSFASLLLAAWAVIARVPPPAWRDGPAFLAFGLVGIALSTVTLTLGLVQVSAGAGSFLVGTIPVFSTLLAWALFRERLSRLGWLGIAISFGGIGLIAFGEGRGFRINLGAGWIVASALCQSIYYVGQKPLLRRYSALQLSVYTILCGTALLLPLAGLLAAELPTAPWQATAVSAYLGLFPIGVAFVTWSYALARAKAARVTSALYAMPAIAIALAWVWLGEVPHPVSLLGGATALIGVAVVTFWGR
jgi:drug/metabolite transporter (DMT)-like permease